MKKLLFTILFICSVCSIEAFEQIFKINGKNTTSLKLSAKPGCLVTKSVPEFTQYGIQLATDKDVTIFNAWLQKNNLQYRPASKAICEQLTP